jgi:hypothetical protein
MGNVAPRRGRPPKFDRPSRLVAVTLPTDTLDQLRRMNPDLARAIVALTQTRPPSTGKRHTAAVPDVDLVQLTTRDALIIVNRRHIASLPGVSVLPLDDERGFLALQADKGVADLVVAVQDRLEEEGVSTAERDALLSMKAHLKAWRRDATLTFESRAIIVATRRPRKGARARGTADRIR